MVGETTKSKSKDDGKIGKKVDDAKRPPISELVKNYKEAGEALGEGLARTATSVEQLEGRVTALESKETNDSEVTELRDDVNELKSTVEKLQETVKDAVTNLTNLVNAIASAFSNADTKFEVVAKFAEGVSEEIQENLREIPSFEFEFVKVGDSDGD